MATKTKKPTKVELIKYWNMANPIKGRDPKTWRKDDQGTVIKFTDFDGSGKYAWEIK